MPLAKLRVGDLEREHLLHVPPALPADRAVPLVLVLPGGNGTAAAAAGLTRFNVIAERAGFFVVYPQGVGRTWNDGRVTRDFNSESLWNFFQAHRQPCRTAPRDGSI